MNLNGFYEKIDGFFAIKDFKSAEDFMLQTLAQAKAVKDDGAIVTVCNELGGFYRAFSRYDEGIPLYEQALASLQALGMENTEAHGTTLLNFATTLSIVGRHQDALDAYTKAAGIFEGPTYARDYRLATLYNNMSSLYQNMGQLAQAEAYLYLAMEILEKLSESEIEIAITYSNLAGVYLAMEDDDRLDDAREAAQRAVDLFTQVSGDQDVHFAAAVTSLGDVCCREGDFAAAETHFRRALALTKRDYGDQTLAYAVLCDNLAQVVTALGRREEAQAFAAEAKAIKERIL